MIELPPCMDPSIPNETNDRQGHGNGKRKDRDNNNNNRNNNSIIKNPNIDSFCRLHHGKHFRYIMHPKNIAGCDTKNDRGEEMCLAFHVSGICYSDCRRSKTHGNLSENAVKKIRYAVKVGRDKNAEFRMKRFSRFSLPTQSAHSYSTTPKVPPGNPPPTTSYPNFPNERKREEKNGEKK